MPVNFGVHEFAKLQMEASEQVAVNLISVGRYWIIRLIRLSFFAVVFFPSGAKGERRIKWTYFHGISFYSLRILNATSV